MRGGAATFWVNGTAEIDNNWVSLEASLFLANAQPAFVLGFHLRSDASNTWGGWNIDDVELYTTAAPVPVTERLQILPEQAVQGTPVALTVQTQGPRPFVLVIGNTSGPTLIPGIPTLQVGGSYITLMGWTDSAGTFTRNFAAPGGVALTGLDWYSQVLTFDQAWQLATSNAFVNLFTR